MNAALSPSARIGLGFLGVLLALSLVLGALDAEAARAASAFELTLRGTRGVMSASIAVFAVSSLVGVGLGALAGSGPPIGDALLARSVELGGALPTVIVLALVLAVEPARGSAAFVLAFGVLRGIELARLVRGEVLRVGGQDFVLAARALGLKPSFVFRRHVLPHALGPLLVSSGYTLSRVVAMHTALGVFGLFSASSWGAVLASGIRSGDRAAIVWPALLLLSTTASLHLLAEAIGGGLGARRRAFRRTRASSGLRRGGG
jgi:ABC-type dipeptide/oligopeptide/nickel transport system permease subunit